MVEELLKDAHAIADGRGHALVGTDHLLLAMTRQSDGSFSRRAAEPPRLTQLRECGPRIEIPGLRQCAGTAPEPVRAGLVLLRRDDARPDLGERAAQCAARDRLAALITVVR